MQKLLLRLNFLRKYLVASILLVVPLYPKFPFLSVPNTYVSIRIEDFLIAISLISFFVFCYRDIKILIKDKISIGIMVFLAAGFLSLVGSIFITQSVELKIGLLHWLRRVEYMSMFFVGFLILKNRIGDLSFYLKLVKIVIALAFLYGIGQKYFNWPIIVTQNQEYAKGIALRYVDGGHINSTFAGHYDLATYLVFLLPMILIFLLSGFGSRIINFVIYVCGLWLLVNTASRISMVAYIVAASISLIILKKFKKGLLLVFLSILFIGFSSNLISRYQRVYEIFSGYIDKYVYIVKPVLAQDEILSRRELPSPTPTPLPVFEDRSTSIRLNVEWPRAVRAFLKNPLLGTGYSSITLATDNDYLRLLGETGILGISSFSYIFVYLYKKTRGYFMNLSIKESFEGQVLASVVGGTCGILINAMFIDVFEASKCAIIFWLVWGMAYNIISSKTLNNTHD